MHGRRSCRRLDLPLKAKADMGKVMAILMPKVKGRADGKVVNQMIQSLLA